MPVYLKILIPVLFFLILLVWLLTKPSGRNGLRPAGGMRIKNMLASLLIRSGRSSTEDSIAMNAVNDRIPPVEGRSLEDYNDSFVFLGMDADGNLIVTRLGFREGGSVVEVWVWMVIDGKRYAIPVDSIQDNSETGESIEAGGLSYRCTDKETGTWKITYDGPMSPDIGECSIELDYLPVSKMYHSGFHMDLASLARAMAEMPWSREYFENLKSENQTRIEQGGYLKGSIVLNDRKKEVDFFGIRDHSWGKRNWSFIYRYIWTVVAMTSPVVLEGHRFDYLIFSTVDYGTSFKNLVTGWIAGPDEVLPISEGTDMSLLGEDGTIPELFTVQLRPKGMPVMKMEIRRVQPEYSWYMHDKTFEVCEAWCEATIRGIKGYGVAEFGYSLLRGYHRNPPEEARPGVSPDSSAG